MKTKSNRNPSRKSKLLKIAKKLARPLGALLLAAVMAGGAAADDVTVDDHGENPAKIILSEERTYVFNGDFTYSLTGNITGGGFGITKTGPGTLGLYGNNDLAGMTLQGGNVRVATLENLDADMKNVSFQGVLNDPDTPTLVFAENAAITLDGDGAADQRLYLNAASGGIHLEAGASLVWQNSHIVHTSSGGTIDAKGGAVALYSGSDFIFTGDANTSLSFNGNLASTTNSSGEGYSFGGAIYSYGGAVSFIGIDSLSFTGNTASGVVVVGASVGIGFGGAIYSGGGAVSFTDIATLSFTGNTAFGSASGFGDGVGYGGAIYSEGGEDIRFDTGGDVTFAGNQAVGTTGAYGGAIYVYADSGISASLEFEIADGKTFLFTGNTTKAGTGSAIASSIYFSASTGTANEILINTIGTGVMDMRDPMTGHAGAPLTITKSGTGTWLLGGSNDFTGDNITFNVTAGTLRLYREGGYANNGLEDAGTISLAGAGSSFTLDSTATLSIGGGNAITTGGNIILGNGSTLAFDIAHHSATATDPMLTLTADSMSVSDLNIDLLSLLGSSQASLINQEIVLVETTGTVANFSSVIDDSRLTYKGEALADTRAAGLVTVEGKNGTIVLTQSDAVENLALIWTGSDSDAWDFTTNNWIDEGTDTPTQFFDGDIVIFNTTDTVAGSFDITLAADMVAGEMRVTGDGDYTFTGASITTDGTASSITTATGKLHLDTATLTLTQANTFNSGVSMTAGTLVLGHDKALGTFVMGGDGTDNAANNQAFMNSAGMLTVTDGAATVKTTQDRTISNRFMVGIPDYPTGVPGNPTGTLAFDIAEDTTLTISGVKNTSEVEGFSQGGAIGVSSHATDPLAFTGGRLVFENNEAALGGAVGIYPSSGPAVLDFTGLQSVAFTGNAAAGQGGGIYAYNANGSSSVTLGEYATFAGNTAGWGDGGGIYSHSNGTSTVTLGAHTAFLGNSARWGGGIYVFSDNGSSLSVNAHTLFEGNTATGQYGGAIHIASGATAGTLTLDTGTGPDAGAIAFTGNTADNAANAVNMINTSLEISGSGNVYFDDPITGNWSNSLVKTGTGFVQFLGTNVLNDATQPGGGVTVSEGTFRLADSATFDLGGNDGNSTFTLASGAALAGTGTLTAADGFTLSGTISPDGDRFEIPDFDYDTNTFAAGRNTVSDTKKIGTLTLTGDAELTGATLAIDLGTAGASDLIVVDGANNDVTLALNGALKNVVTVTPVPGASTGGDYLIMQVLGGGVFTDGSQTGQTLLDTYFEELPTTARMTGQLELLNGDTELWITGFSIVNTAITWNGAAGDVWGTTDAWLDGSDAADTFLNGDTVIFTGNGAQSAVGFGTVYVSDMTVDGGYYLFIGDAIHSTVSADLPSAEQKLAVGGDAVAVFFSDLDFAGGIEVSGDSTVQLHSGAAATTAGAFAVTDDATLVVHAESGAITAGSFSMDTDTNAAVAWGGGVPFGDTEVTKVITTDNAMDAGVLDKFAETGPLREQEAFFGDADNKELGLRLTQISITDYGQTNGFGRNLQNIADLYDQAYAGGVLGPVGDAMYGAGSAQQLMAFLNAARGGEVAADAQRMALWNPWTITNNRLYEMLDNDGCRVLSRNCGTNLWFEGYYRDQNVSGDGNALGYGHTRGGLALGCDTQLDDNFMLGVMFGYGNPTTGNGVARVEADDYTFALYAQTRLTENIYLNGFLGYGHQEYDYRHRASGSEASYGGDAMYFSLEFFRPVVYSAWTTFLPLVALDYQKSWSDGFTDYGAPSAAHYGSGDLEQLVLRLGLNGQYFWYEQVKFRTRLQYAYLMAGDTHGAVRMSLAANPSASHMITGVDIGKHTLNVGLGGEFLLSADGSLSVYADYDFYVSDHATTHGGVVGMMKKW